MDNKMSAPAPGGEIYIPIDIYSRNSENVTNCGYRTCYNSIRKDSKLIF